MSIKFECPYTLCREESCECDVCSHSIMLLFNESRIDFEGSLFRKYLLWNVEEIDSFRLMAGHYSYNENDSDNITWDTLTALLIYRGNFEKVSLFDFRNIEKLLRIIHRYDKTYKISKNIPKDFLVSSLIKSQNIRYKFSSNLPASFARVMLKEDMDSIFGKYLKIG